jgi:periplasmic divalent cation tolerance protein
MNGCGPASGDVVALITTLPGREEAIALGRSAVEARLAACAQVEGPVTSVYEWKGVIEQSSEHRLVLKTFARLSAPLEAFLRERHPYEVPEFATSGIAVSEDYLSWMKSLLGE